MNYFKGYKQDWFIKQPNKLTIEGFYKEVNWIIVKFGSIMFIKQIK